MARPREFDCAASKQAAYRARHVAKLVSVDRAALAGLHDRLERLQSAIVCAARNGSGFANRCRASSIDSMLDNLIDAFMDEAVGLDGASPRVAVPSESLVLES
ncbi:hypothetical protein [Armatimonas sp.]|uniref:hypothetical protein n=1 Tax=Armatimonas sp. TaxID=1872638 RepID=UPI003753D800